jgi:hypothetical protein
MRTIVIVVLAVFLQPALASGPAKLVYLDRPGALEALAVENPAHYRQAVEVLRVAETLPCKPMPKLSAAKFRAADCQATLLMTSFPPKRRVSFTLDDTDYIAVVTITDAGARPMPAK